MNTIVDFSRYSFRSMLMTVIAENENVIFLSISWIQN